MKRLLLTLALVVGLCQLWANPVSYETAVKAAERFASLQGISVKDNPIVNLAPEGMFRQMYILGFGGAKGFVIISADDRALPVLGYSLESYFSADNMPNHIREWYLDYEDQIDYLVNNGIEPSAIVQREWSMLIDPTNPLMHSTSVVVGPLLNTTWNQSPYYNSLCPTKGGETTPTGCVATATAQVMKYWNHPATGHGSHSYEWNSQTLSADFENTTYSWSDMPNSLDNTSTPTQVNAVATLMYHVGVAMEMLYNVSSAGGSGAFTCAEWEYGPSAESVLQTHFKYSNDIRSITYKDFADAQWKTILRSELDANRVILYSGRGQTGGGHSFCCDGYNDNNQFHFNWGWGGYCDAFYTLGSLNPAPGGVGGNSSSSYNIKNMAVIGIQPITGSLPATTTVTVLSADTAKGTAYGSGVYDQYDTIIVSVSAKEGYILDRWDDNSRTNPRYTLATTSTFQKTAYFKALPTDTLSFCGYEEYSGWGMGNQSETYNWGFRYPANTLPSHKILTEVQFVPTETGQYTIRIYQGDGASMSQTYSQQFSVSSISSSWMSIPLTTPCAVDSSRALWVTLEYTGTGYPMSFSTYYGGNHNGAMSYEEGNWLSYNDYGVYLSWCVRGVLENVQTSYNTLIANASPADGGTVLPNTSFYVQSGTTVNLEAFAVNNYRFVDWSDGVTTYQKSEIVTANKSITANFESLGRDTVGYCVHNYSQAVGPTSGTMAWGIRFVPGSPLQGRQLDGIRYYCPDTLTNDITVKICTGGLTKPRIIVSQFTISPDTNSGWQNYMLPNSFQCGSDTMWILLYYTAPSAANDYPCSYTSYSANPNGALISFDGGQTFGNMADYSYDATWMLQALVSDVPRTTIDVEYTSASELFYPEDNDLYITLSNDDYTFYFDVYTEQGFNDIVDGQHYTLDDMIGYYSYGISQNPRVSIVYDSVDLVRNDGVYTVRVVKNNNTVYNIFYSEPVVEPKDTVYLNIDNKKTCRVEDYIEDMNMFQLMGTDSAEVYTLFFVIQNATQIPGTYSATDVSSEYTYMYKSTPTGAVAINFVNLLPDAVITADSTTGGYNATIHYLGSDTVLYEITFSYADPVPATVINFTAPLQISQNEDYEFYVQQYGIYPYDFVAADSNVVFKGTVYNDSLDTPYGTYSFDDENLYAAYYDAATGEELLYEPISGSVTIGEVGHTVALTGSMLCYGDVQFVNNCKYALALDTLQVTLLPNDSAMGSVTGGGMYAYGDTATLVATPAANYHLISWSNGATNDTIYIIVTQDTILTATFAEDTITYTVTASGENGTVIGAGVYEYGATATLTATPDANYHFVSWSNGATTATISIVVTQDTTLTATFAIDTHTVTVTGENGTVTGGGVYEYGDTATLTATPDANYHFVSWSNGATTATISIVVTQDTTLTATFAIDTHTVTVTGENGTVTGGGVYEYGDTATLTATPDANYHFVSWSNGTTTATISIVVTQDTTLTATFAIDTHTVTVTGENGTVTGGGVYEYGDTATLTAIPDANYHFVSWSNGATTATISIVVTQDTTLTATFAIDSFTVTVAANDAKMGVVTGGGIYEYGATATLTATANTGYKFTGWSNGETTATISIIVDQDTTLTANFEAEVTSVENVEESEYIVYTEGSRIVVCGASEVFIFDAAGRTLYNGKTDSSTAQFDVYVPGVYFVRCDNSKSYRIVVR